MSVRQPLCCRNAVLFSAEGKRHTSRRFVYPIRYSSTALAALRPSVIAQTTSDCLHVSCCKYFGNIRLIFFGILCKDGVSAGESDAEHFGRLLFAAKEACRDEKKIARDCFRAARHLAHLPVFVKTNLDRNNFLQAPFFICVIFLDRRLIYAGIVAEKRLRFFMTIVHFAYPDLQP